MRGAAAVRLRQVGGVEPVRADELGEYVGGCVVGLHALDNAAAGGRATAASTAVSQGHIYGGRARGKSLRHGISGQTGCHSPKTGSLTPQAPQAGSAASIAATISGDSGSVCGEKRAATVPSAEIRNFSKFHRMSPVWPSASAAVTRRW